MRILIVSNAPWVPSGYGQQTAEVSQRMLRDGHDVHIYTCYGLQGAKAEWNGIPVWHSWDAGVFHPEGIEGYANYLKPDIVITLIDVFALPEAMGLLEGVNWVPWIPIDMEPLSVIKRKRLDNAFHILPFSKYGVKILDQVGFGDRTTYVPLGIDTNVFRPDIEKTKKDIKLSIGFDRDDFVVGMVAANNTLRKNIMKVIMALPRLIVTKKLPIHLVLHTHKTGFQGGLDIKSMLDGLSMVEHVSMTDPFTYHLGYTQEQMATMYNSFDMLANPAAYEGFGIPIVESQACGVPVLTTDFTSMPELTFGGVCIPPAGLEYIQHHKAFCANVSEVQIEIGIEEIYNLWYNDREEYLKMCQMARVGSLEYNYDDVYDKYWRPTLAMLEEKLDEVDIGKLLEGSNEA